ncbi:MAG: hypothetical protein KDD36_05045 [Flavobacteriales bacterium]|nr:hypothetical protein [Flavobacteriales bacterium]
MMHSRILGLSVFLLTSVFAKAQHEAELALSLQQQRASIIQNAANDPQFKQLHDFATQNNFAPLKSVDAETIANQLAAFKTSQNAKNGTTATEVPNSLVSLVGQVLSPQLNEGELITALTEVIVSRAKEELAMAYFDRLALRMAQTDTLKLVVGCQATKTSPYLQTYQLKSLFPNFYLLIRNGQQNLNGQVGHTLKVALEKDIHGLYDNVSANLIPACLKQDPAYALVDIAVSLVEGLSAGQHPATVMRNIRPDHSSEMTTADHLLNVLVGVSESMLSSKGQNETWMKPSELNKLDKQGLIYYFNLFYHNPDHKASLNALVSDMTEQHMHKLLNLWSHFFSMEAMMLQAGQQNAMSEAQFFGNNGAGIPSPAAATVSDENRLAAITAMVRQWLGTVNQLQDLLNIKDDRIRKGLAIAPYVLDLTDELGEHQYSAAILSVFRVLSELVPEESGLSADLVKYLTLAADVAEAKSTEDAKDILETAILPVGSYRIKRSVPRSLFLSSYVGATGGYEWMDHNKLSGVCAPYLGPYLPIGIEYCTSKGTETRTAASHSILFSLLDLGVVAGYSFINDSQDSSVAISSVPELKLQNILSPGLSYVYGFRNAPLSIGAGVAFSPRLREIYNSQDVQVGLANGLRLQLSVMVDVPLLNLTVGGKKKGN